MSGSGGTSCSGPATSGRRWRPAVPVPGNPNRIACSLPLLDASLGRGRVSRHPTVDRKSTRLNSSHDQISYAVFCLKKEQTKYYLSVFSKKKNKKNRIHTKN